MLRQIKTHQDNSPNIILLALLSCRGITMCKQLNNLTDIWHKKRENIFLTWLKTKTDSKNVPGRKDLQRFSEVLQNQKYSSSNSWRDHLWRKKKHTLF